MRWRPAAAHRARCASCRRCARGLPPPAAAHPGSVAAARPHPRPAAPGAAAASPRRPSPAAAAATGEPDEVRIGTQLPVRGTGVRAGADAQRSAPLGAAGQLPILRPAAGCQQRLARIQHAASGNRQRRRAVFTTLTDPEGYRSSQPLSGEARVLQMPVRECQRPAQRRERRQAGHRAQFVAVQERHDAHARRWRDASAARGRLADVDVDHGLAAQVDVADRRRPCGELRLCAQPGERLLCIAGEAPAEAQQRRVPRLSQARFAALSWKLPLAARAMRAWPRLRRRRCDRCRARQAMDQGPQGSHRAVPARRRTAWPHRSTARA